MSTHPDIPEYDRHMQTYTGRRFFPLTPRPADVAIEDIAHALGMICRYGGHSRLFYSVAQHSCLIALAIERDYPDRKGWQLMGLMHDASEAYLLDVIRPIKPFLVGYYEMEARVEHCIQRALSLPTDPEGAVVVKTYDTRILRDETKALMGEPDWSRTIGEPLGMEIGPWSPWTAEQYFLAQYRALTAVVEPEKRAAVEHVLQRERIREQITERPAKG